MMAIEHENSLEWVQWCEKAKSNASRFNAQADREFGGAFGNPRNWLEERRNRREGGRQKSLSAVLSFRLDRI